MLCPYCGNRCPDSARVCPECGQLLFEGAPAADAPSLRERVLHIAFICACWLVSLALVGLGIYKVYFWIDTYRINRLYLRGSRAPAVNEITLADGRPGHSITFFADSGDQIFIEELGRSYAVSGGFARIELPDSTWFRSADLTEVESAIVTLNPFLIRESGDTMRLPQLELNVTAPGSPLTVLNPERDGMEIYTAIFPLQLQVVSGSSVYVNGADVSDLVDRGGLLNYNLNVYPVGNNVITVLVRTPDHRETRRDVVIYRAQMEVNLELSLSTMNESETETMTVSGKCDPGATLTVDSAFVEDSLVMDPETGDFRFLAKFNTIGENTVSFRASMEGKRDSVIRFAVKYLPGEDDYTKMAWTMDYPSLQRMFEQWKGRVFKCVGPVVDTFEEDGLKYFVMDVGTEGLQQFIILIDYSGRTDITSGYDFAAFADVQGRKMYNSIYFPLLNARYVYKRST